MSTKEILESSMEIKGQEIILRAKKAEVDPTKWAVTYYYPIGRKAYNRCSAPIDFMGKTPQDAFSKGVDMIKISLESL